VKSATDPLLIFERSARRDLRWWLMALVGAAFLFASQTVRPEENCSADGECAPWLVPLAGVMGAVVLAGGAGQLLANPRRGSRIDPAAGTLEWWQGRTRGWPGDHGAIALADIARIRIQRRDEGSDAVSLYDRNGERQPFFDSEVIPWRHENWARSLMLIAPWIELDLTG
jgi:hypothetical protein